MGFYPFVPPLPSGAAIAGALAGQTITGNLTVTGVVSLGSTPGNTAIIGTGGVNIGGSADFQTVGTGLAIKEGANAKQGTFTLAGAATTVVANTSVTASSRILLTTQTLGTVTAASTLAISARTAGTSFTVTPSQATDTSTIAFEIFEPG